MTHALPWVVEVRTDAGWRLVTRAFSESGAESIRFRLERCDAVCGRLLEYRVRYWPPS